MFVAQLAVTCRVIYARNTRVTKVSFLPYYLGLFQALVAVIYVTVLLSLRDQPNLDSFFYEFWTLLTIHVTCVIMFFTVLVYTLIFELLIALIKFQWNAGPGECAVRRDEHFNTEKKIIKTFIGIAGVVVLAKIFAIIDDRVREHY